MCLCARTELQAMNSISSSHIHLHPIHSPSSHYTMWLKWATVCVTSNQTRGYKVRRNQVRKQKLHKNCTKSREQIHPAGSTGPAPTTHSEKGSESAWTQVKDLWGTQKDKFCAVTPNTSNKLFMELRPNLPPQHILFHRRQVFKNIT